MARRRLLSNDGMVLIHIARYPTPRLTDIADAVGITERAVQTILQALESDKIISRHKEGRGRRYVMHFEALLASELLPPVSVQEVARVLRGISSRLAEKPEQRQTRGSQDDEDVPDR